MSQQLIITIGREFGSGGHQIANTLAQRFNLPLYDSNILKEIAFAKDVDHAELERYDEVPKNRLFSKTRRGHSSSPEENIAHLQFTYLRDKAEQGESFVVVGRCAETILKGYPGMISIFVLADKEAKIARIAEYNHITNFEADVIMGRQNRNRKMYHNYYCPNKWGDSRNYDISINSTRLGVEKTADFLENYIKERMK